MKKQALVFISLLFIIRLLPVFGQQPLPFQDPALSLDSRLQDLMQRLTVKEKAQLMLYNSPAIPRLQVPAYNWWNECLHGVARNGRATVFPQAIGMAASFDSALVFRVASAIADEARQKHFAAQAFGNAGQYNGLSFWSPNINIFRDPRWGRGQETYGEDPCLTACMGIAFVKGLQGDHPDYLKTSACAKHFAVHSGPENGRHFFNAEVDEKDLRETYLPAFEKLVGAGVESVMCAYNRLNSQPCCGSDQLLRSILREEWHFKGHIVTDCWALDDIWLRHKTVNSREEAAAMALHAGVNLNCGYLYDSLPAMLLNKVITEPQIDEALKPLLRTRFRLGLLDLVQGKDTLVSHPYRNPGKLVLHPELAREAAVKSCVLLKNQNQVLPLPKNIPSLFITGPYAADNLVLLGNYHGLPAQMTSILEGIMSKVQDACQVQYALGTARGTENIGGVWASSFAEAIIVVGGFSPLEQGEEGDALYSDAGGDLPDFALPGKQLELIRQLRGNHSKPIILVLTGGSCIGLAEVEPLVDAILMAWYPGEQGGNAVADLLFGDACPSGKLPLSFYRSVNDLPPFSDYQMKGRTYRYFSGEVLYPFGHGLSYSSFHYSGLSADKSGYYAGDSIRVSLRCSNTGNCMAEEVIQLYVSKIDPDRRDPIKQLLGFRRVPLRSGESREVHFMLSTNDLRSWNMQTQRWEVRDGDYLIQAGASAADIRLCERIRLSHR